MPVAVTKPLPQYQWPRSNPSSLIQTFLSITGGGDQHCDSAPGQGFRRAAAISLDQSSTRSAANQHRHPVPAGGAQRARVVEAAEERAGPWIAWAHQRVVPALCALIEPFYPKPGNSRPPGRALRVSRGGIVEEMSHKLPAGRGAAVLKEPALRQ
jgi:hypothetical protein